MKERVKYDEGLENKLRTFVKRLMQEAKACQAYVPGFSKSSPTGTTKQNNEKMNSSVVPNQKDNARHVNKDRKVVCIYPPHKEKGLKQKLKDCKACPEDQKKSLFDEYTKERAEERRKSKHARRVGNHDEIHDNSSVLFTSVFADKIRGTIRANNGADVKIIDSATLENLKDAGTELGI